MLTNIVQKHIIIWFIIIYIAAGCAEPGPLKPKGAEIDWQGQPHGLVLRLKASQRLNWHDEPSSLLVCLYQLNDTLSLENIAKTDGGLTQLLTCQAFDDCVVTADRFFISPGEEKEIFLDRQDNAKKVAVVAGYYDLDRTRAVKFWDVPLVKFSTGWFSTPGLKPAQLVMDIFFGATEILPAQWQLVFQPSEQPQADEAKSP